MLSFLIDVKEAVNFPNCIIYISTLAIKLLEPTITHFKLEHPDVLIDIPGSQI